MANELLNDELDPMVKAALCEQWAGELLGQSANPSVRAVAEAQALATLGQSYRLRCIEKLMRSGMQA